MSKEVLLLLVFVAATLIGYKLIVAVPSLLHTPLMSGMNALSGVTLLGMVAALALTGAAGAVWLKVLGFIGVVAATINVVAGFGVTDRMLRMFKTEQHKEDKE